MITKQIWLISVLPTLLMFSGCSSGSDSGIGLDQVPPTLATARPAISVFDIGTDGDHPSLGNKPAGSGNIRDTGLGVMSGDRIEIRPTCILRERRKVPDPKVVRIDNDVCAKTDDVCIASEPVFEHRCEDQCHVCVKCQAFPPACYPWRCCDNVCQDVHVGDRCVRSEPRCVQRENQWKELTQYLDLEAPQLVRDLLPMSTPALLLDAIKLRFTLPTTGEVVCPLRLFKPDTDSEKITVSLRNVPGCDTLFAPSETNRTTLGVVNEMSAPIHYLQGNLVKTWDGRVLEQPVESVFYPEIDFLGSVSVFAAGGLK